MDADAGPSPASAGPPPPMRIGGVIVDPPLALAPMAGVGDVHFRRLVRGFGGVGLVVTEFALAEGLAERDPRALAKLRFAEDERPVAVQILGADPETARRAAAVAQSLEPDLCDLNLGCPMRKITRRGAGVALMDEPERAARLIEACRRELSVPLTLKLRLGRREGPEGETYLEIARIAEELGVAAIALHPRSGRAMYDGRADWRHVGRLAGAVGIPVIGNGDVRAPEDAVRRKRETGCDGVMIGRAAIARPWIFRQVAALWEGRGEPGMEPAQARRALLEGLREIAREQPEPVARHRLRCFAGRYAKEEPGTAALGRGLGQARDTREILDLLADHLDPDRAASNA